MVNLKGCIQQQDTVSLNDFWTMFKSTSYYHVPTLYQVKVFSIIWYCIQTRDDELYAFITVKYIYHTLYDLLFSETLNL